MSGLLCILSTVPPAGNLSFYEAVLLLHPEWPGAPALSHPSTPALIPPMVLGAYFFCDHQTADFWQSSAAKPQTRRPLVGNCLHVPRPLGRLLTQYPLSEPCCRSGSRHRYKLYQLCVHTVLQRRPYWCAPAG